MSIAPPAPAAPQPAEPPPVAPPPVEKTEVPMVPQSTPAVAVTPIAVAPIAPVEPLVEGCCATDPRVAKAPLDTCMLTTACLSGLALVLGIVGVIVGAVGSYTSIPSIMVAIVGVIGVIAVFMKNKGMMVTFVIVAGIVIGIALLWGSIEAFVGTIAGGICDAFLADEEAYYKCPTHCSGTTCKSTGTGSTNDCKDGAGYCANSDCCTGMGSKKYCLWETTWNDCEKARGLRNSAYVMIPAGIIALVGSCAGCFTVCCNGYFFKPTPEQLMAMQSSQPSNFN